MKSINSYINKAQFDLITSVIESEMIANEFMVCEAFKSSIVQKLAKAIYDAEKDNNQRNIAYAKKEDEQYGTQYGKHQAKITSFASIFGPKTETSRFGKSKKGIQGLKWSEITDEDFKEYGPTDKELVKLIKQTYGKKDGNADFIVMKDGEVINFIKAYGKDEKSDGMYYFKASEVKTWGNGETSPHYYKSNSEVKELTKPYYSYQTRSLKTSEVLSVLQGLESVGGVKVYALVITNDMIKDYKDLTDKREKDQEGVINYDKASLEAMLRKQKARYEAIVKEIKAKKLTDNKSILFDEIKKVNQEAVDFVQMIMSKPEYIDKFYGAGDIMQYVAKAYETYYDAIKKFRTSDKRKERAKKRAEENGEKYDDKDFDKWDFDKEGAKESIRDAESWIKKARNKIEEYKKEL